MPFHTILCNFIPSLFIFNKTGTYEHEIMHALGYIHEHSRPDRDDYLDVRMENIEKENAANFQKYKMDEVRILWVPFIFGSLNFFWCLMFLVPRYFWVPCIFGSLDFFGVP